MWLVQQQECILSVWTAPSASSPGINSDRNSTFFICFIVSHPQGKSSTSVEDQNSNQKKQHRILSGTKERLGAGANICNLSYSGGADQEDQDLKPAPSPRQIVFETLSPKDPSQKRAGGVAQGVGPRSNPSISKKKFFFKRTKEGKRVWHPGHQSVICKAAS
jgi:hypothetical protein